MISEIRIQNFKSIEDLTLKLGRVTVLIGENGSGKSNIIEAIAFAAGASTDKLDREFLYSRGIRVTENNFTISAFPIADGQMRNEDIEISVRAENLADPLDYTISPKRRDDDNSFAGWFVRVPVSDAESTVKMSSPKGTAAADEFLKNLFESASIWAKQTAKTSDGNTVSFTREELMHAFSEAVAKRLVVENKRLFLRKGAEIIALSDFLIYAPENTSLRTFDPESAIEPLGAKGEGLLKLLQSFGEEKYASHLAELKESLHLFGWFDDFILPTTEDTVRDRLQLKDRWLAPDRDVFDQRSANEGFLYVLFYLTLLMSWRTPRFFALDNVDNALNPKLCYSLMQQIIELAKKYDKQVICTTHNPAILDGLDLNDDEQRLYSVRRDEEGRTKIRRVRAPQPQPNESPVRLSEAFMRGLIGGLPAHF